MSFIKITILLGIVSLLTSCSEENNNVRDANKAKYINNNNDIEVSDNFNSTTKSSGLSLSLPIINMPDSAKKSWEITVLNKDSNKIVSKSIQGGSSDESVIIKDIPVGMIKIVIKLIVDGKLLMEGVSNTEVVENKLVPVNISLKSLIKKGDISINVEIEKEKTLKEDSFVFKNKNSNFVITKSIKKCDESYYNSFESQTYYINVEQNSILSIKRNCNHDIKTTYAIPENKLPHLNDEIENFKELILVREKSYLMRKAQKANGRKLLMENKPHENLKKHSIAKDLPKTCVIVQTENDITYRMNFDIGNQTYSISETDEVKENSLCERQINDNEFLNDSHYELFNHIESIVVGGEDVANISCSRNLNNKISLSMIGASFVGFDMIEDLFATSKENKITKLNNQNLPISLRGFKGSFDLLVEDGKSYDIYITSKKLGTVKFEDIFVPVSKSCNRTVEVDAYLWHK